MDLLFFKSNFVSVTYTAYCSKSDNNVFTHKVIEYS